MTEIATASEPEALTAALAYAERGWPVAPAHSVKPDRSCTCGDAKCTSRGKHPLTAHGLKDASIDTAVIRAWWEKWPHANVLIRTGMIAGRCLIALDIDPRHNGDESLARLIVDHGDLPETPQCNTGGGGQHIFMWSSTSIPNSAGKANDGRFGEGVDVRGEGGYVIAAPSKHESGRSYTWDAGAHPVDVTLAQAPAWFVHLASRSKQRTAVGDLEPGIDRYISGGRNDALMRLAGAMRRVGTGLKRITDALLDENEERCHPPLDPAEVKKIARSAVKYAAGDPSAPGVDPFPLCTAADMAQPLPAVPWVCEALGLAPGAVTIVGGAGFGGKTISMQALALAIASGKPLWGHLPVAQGRAIHIDYEQGRRLTQDRYQRLANAMGLDLATLSADAFGVSCLPRGKLDDAATAEDNVVRLCTGARIAIVDAFRGAFPKAKENDSASREHLDMLQQASERTGCAMFVIMHSRKAGEDNDVRSSLRGSSSLFDAAQTVFMLDGHRTLPTRVHHTKDRILGILQPTFGLTITDVSEMDQDSNSRWGLDVKYLAPEEVTNAYAKDENDFSASAERLHALAARVIAIITAQPDGVPVVMMKSMFGCRAIDVQAVLGMLIRSNDIQAIGRGAEALYIATRYREPGEEG